MAAYPDRLVESLVLRAVEPASLGLSFRAAERAERDRERLHAHWAQRLERAGYEASRARRQYDAVDPENRLVARELERQGEQKLAEQRQPAEDHARFQAEQPRHLGAADRERIGTPAADLPGLWQSPTTTGGDRRAVVRLLIEGVGLTRAGESERIDVTIHWRGGAVTRHVVRQGLRAYRALGGLAKLRERILELRGDGQTADGIAEVLNREGYQVARGVGFAGDRVRQLLARFGQTGIPPRGGARRGRPARGR